MSGSSPALTVTGFLEMNHSHLFREGLSEAEGTFPDCGRLGCGGRGRLCSQPLPSFATSACPCDCVKGAGVTDSDTQNKNTGTKLRRLNEKECIKIATCVCLRTSFSDCLTLSLSHSWVALAQRVGCFSELKDPLCTQAALCFYSS